jgi:ribonuclease III
MEELQQLLGYTFHKSELLDQALRHRPAVNENFTKNENVMEPLQALGDAVLGAVVGFWLYDNGDRQKGTLSEEKIRKVKHFTNRKFSEKIRIRQFIQGDPGNPESETWVTSNKALDTVFLALIGAVFLDAQQNRKNGVLVVREMLERLEYF